MRKLQESSIEKEKVITAYHVSRQTVSAFVDAELVEQDAVSPLCTLTSFS
jgi:hypothetical protein